MKTFSVLASLVRAANPWLSKATCSCKSTYGIVGVSPNLLSMSMINVAPSSAHGYVFIGTLVVVDLLKMISQTSITCCICFGGAITANYTCFGQIPEQQT